jgi:hypothetical protein
VADNSAEVAKDNEWFTEDILAKGNSITVKVNDKIVAQWTQPNDWAVNSIIAKHAAVLFTRSESVPSRQLRGCALDASPAFSNTFPTRPICSSASFHCFCSMLSRTPGSVRELDSLTAHQLPGTDGAANPFWST